MVTQGLPVSTFVDINTSAAVGGVLRRPFGRGLLITTDDALAAGGTNKARLYNNLAEMQVDFSSGDALDAATVWFSGDPIPQGLWVGRWVTSDTPTTLRGGAAPSAAGAVPLNATNATFDLAGNTVTANLSTAGTLAAVAAVLQPLIAAVGGIFVGATFLYDTDRFLLTLASTEDISPPYFGTALTGTDISAALGMALADNPIYALGLDAETAVEAAGEILALAAAGPPVAIMLSGDAPDAAGTPPVNTRRALGAWANAGDYMFGLRDSSALALTANETTSELAVAFSANQGKTFGAYGTDGTYPDIGGLALLSGQNLNNAASIITVHAKAVPGVPASPLNATQYAELERKRVNVVAYVGGLATMVGGYTSRAGYWADAQWWLLWIKNEMELSIWNAMRGSRRLTYAILVDAITEVLDAGVRNGGIRPGGGVNAQTKADVIATSGNEAFDGVLPTGYALWVERDSQASQVDRESRQRAFKAWLAPQPAIHKVTGDVVLGG